MSFCLFFLSIGIASALSIEGSKHDFSPTGSAGGYSGNFYTSASRIKEICVFCHTPHGSTSSLGLLWNRTNSTHGFDTYSSSTLNATVGMPTGTSLMCMSCHDGVSSIAVNTLLNAPGAGNPPVNAYDTSMGDVIGDTYYLDNMFTDGTWGPNIGELIPGDTFNSNMTNDHPVSFFFDAALLANDQGLQLPSNTELLKRLGSAGSRRLECSTCHNVHDNAIPPFLVMDNTGSAMCLQCHKK